MKYLKMGYYGDYYWSGKHWYIASKEGRNDKPLAVGAGLTQSEALKDLRECEIQKKERLVRQRVYQKPYNDKARFKRQQHRNNLARERERLYG